MEDPANLLRKALDLPLEARAALAGRLIESLHPPPDQDAEAVWDEEISRRIEELDSGKVTAIPWAEVRRRIQARIDAARAD